MKLFTLFLETSFHNMWFGTYALFKKMSYLYHHHGKFRKALTWERTENVSNLIWKYFLMVTYFKFTQDIPPFCVKAAGYVYFILLSSAATIEFFSFSLPTRRFMKSLSLSWHKKCVPETNWLRPRLFMSSFPLSMRGRFPIGIDSSSIPVETELY